VFLEIDFCGTIKARLSVLLFFWGMRRMNRYKAALIHLLSSALVLGTLFVLIAYVWYPYKLFTLGAGAELLTLIACVDLVAGPMVMLIIFDANKRLIKMDVAIVIVFQLAFMAYGVWSMYHARPVYMAYSNNHFYLVRANEIAATDLSDATLDQFKRLPMFGPVMVGTREPDDPKVQQDLLFAGMEGMGVQNLPKYYVPYETLAAEVIKSGKTVNQLGVEMEVKKRVTEYEKTLHRSVLYLPMVNKLKPLIVVVDAKTAQFVDLI
jgi:hypothetical protein